MPPMPEPPPYQPQAAAQPPSQQQQLQHQQQQPSQVQRVPSMDSQPSEASEEGGVSEDLDNSVHEASQPDPGVQSQVEQHVGPIPHPKMEPAVAVPRELPAEQPSVAAAAVPAPLPTGPRVTVPVGWKRIVLLDSVIYYR